MTVTLLKILFAVMCVTMTIIVIKTFMVSDLFVTCGRMWRDEPWFKTTIYDFYFNITILSCWTYYKEKYKAVALLWIVGFVCLGSIATSLYVLLQLLALKPGEPFSKALLKNS